MFWSVHIAEACTGPLVAQQFKLHFFARAGTALVSARWTDFWVNVNVILSFLEVMFIMKNKMIITINFFVLENSYKLLTVGNFFVKLPYIWRGSPVNRKSSYLLDGIWQYGLSFSHVLVGWLCWGLTSQSTIFQSCRDGAIAFWVINQYFWGVKCLAQGHNTAEVGLEPRTSRSGVRHSTTEPPRSPFPCVRTGNSSTQTYKFDKQNKSSFVYPFVYRICNVSLF